MGHDMTPDELRKWALGFAGQPNPDPVSVALAAADAWEAEHVKLMQFMVGANKLQDYIEGLEKRLEAAEKAIYDGRLFPAHFTAWADDIEHEQGFKGSELTCLLRRLAALAGEK